MELKAFVIIPNLQNGTLGFFSETNSSYSLPFSKLTNYWYVSVSILVSHVGSAFTIYFLLDYLSSLPSAHWHKPKVSYTWCSTRSLWKTVFGDLTSWSHICIWTQSHGNSSTWNIHTCLAIDSAFSLVYSYILVSSTTLFSVASAIMKWPSKFLPFYTCLT